MNMVVFLQLLLAHLLTDFVIQTDEWVRKKQENGLVSYHFWLHIFFSGFLTYIFLQQWTNWGIPLFIMGTHAIIDFVKLKLGNKNLYFFLDQLLHLIVILAAWFMMTSEWNMVSMFFQDPARQSNSLLIVSSVVFLVWPVGVIIGILTESLRMEIDSDDSLKNAGKIIGITERLLVFIFMIAGMYQAIGFLIAGKSILRIARVKDEHARKKTEYVLIGTLMSFTAAVLVGLLVKHILGL